MALETAYKNTEVVLTTKLTPGQKNTSKYFKCLAVILATLFLVTVELEDFLLLTLCTVALLWLLGMKAMARPQIIMDVDKRSIRLTNSFNFWKKKTILPKQIARITVVAEEADKGKRKPTGPYRPQLVLKSEKKQKDKTLIDGFELSDIVEAHYAAQLIAAFARQRAYDIKGNVLPSLKSVIPTKYLSGKPPQRAIPVTIRKKAAKAEG